MAQLDERHQQMVLKADEICNRLTPYTDYMVIMHDALMQMAQFVEEMPAKSPWVDAKKQKPRVDTDDTEATTSVVVFVRMESGFSNSAYYNFDDSEWRDAGTNWRIKDPVSWMEIPE